jgi:hypothetical protein
MQTVAFRSPYDRKMMVRIEVPRGSSVHSLGKASDCAAMALEVAEGKRSFEEYPTSIAGVLGLAVLAASMREEDDVAVSGMTGALSFARQIEPMIERNHPLNASKLRGSCSSFSAKYGPSFVRYAVEKLAGMTVDFAGDEEKVERLKKISRLVAKPLEKMTDGDLNNVVVKVSSRRSDEVPAGGEDGEPSGTVRGIELDIVRT